MGTVISARAAPSTPIVAAICAAEILSLAGLSIVPAPLPQFIAAWTLTNTQAGWRGDPFPRRFAGSRARPLVPGGREGGVQKRGR